MKAILVNLLSDQSTANVLILLVSFILFYFLLKREFRYENKANMELIKENLKAHTSQIMAEIKPIREALTNHVIQIQTKKLIT